MFCLFYRFTTWIKPHHIWNFTEIGQFYRKKSPKTQKTWFFKLACEGPKNRKISLFFVLSAQKYPKQRLFNILGSIPNFLDIMKEPILHYLKLMHFQPSFFHQMLELCALEEVRKNNPHTIPARPLDKVPQLSDRLERQSSWFWTLLKFTFHFCWAGYSCFN